MAVDKASVLLIAPELSSVGDESFSATIAHAQQLVNRDAFGTLADTATNYLVAHLLTGTGAGQEIQSVSVGPVSKTFRTSSTADSGFSSTRYGAHYMRLVKACIHAVAVT